MIFEEINVSLLVEKEWDGQKAAIPLLLEKMQEMKLEKFSQKLKKQEALQAGCGFAAQIQPVGKALLFIYCILSSKIPPHKLVFLFPVQTCPYGRFPEENGR